MVSAAPNGFRAYARDKPAILALFGLADKPGVSLCFSTLGRLGKKEGEIKERGKVGD
jgi:hypothetical protein